MRWWELLHAAIAWYIILVQVSVRAVQEFHGSCSLQWGCASSRTLATKAQWSPPQLGRSDKNGTWKDMKNGIHHQWDIHNMLMKVVQWVYSTWLKETLPVIYDMHWSCTMLRLPDTFVHSQCMVFACVCLSSFSTRSRNQHSELFQPAWLVLTSTLSPTWVKYLGDNHRKA